MLNHFLQYVVPANTLQQLVLAPFKSGWGIATFLTLSGFLVGASLFKNTALTRAEARRFLIRRACRVLPLYYAVLAVVLLILPREWPDAAAHMSALRDNQFWLWTLFANVAVALKGNWLFFGDQINLVHLWTVSLQEQLVLAALLFTLLLPRRAVPWILAAMVVCPVFVRLWMQSAGYPGVSMYTFTLARMDAFAGGALLAWWWRDGINLARFRPAFILAALVPIAAWTVAAAHNSHFWNHTFMTGIGYGLQTCTLVAAIALLLQFPTSRIAKILDLAPLRFLGKYSFGLFCLHMLIVPMVVSLFGMDWADERMSFAAGLCLTMIALPLSLLAAIIAHHGFERPFVLLGEWLTTPAQPRTLSRRTLFTAARPALTLCSVALLLMPMGTLTQQLVPLSDTPAPAAEPPMVADTADPADSPAEQLDTTPLPEPRPEL